MLVSDLMTSKLRTLGANATVEDALNLLEELFIRHVPIVDEEGRLLGLVTQRDLLAWEHKKMPDVPIREVMRTGLVTASPSQTLRSAAETMIFNKYGCLPVVDDGLLVGIITETDFLKLAIFPVGRRSECK